MDKVDVCMQWVKDEGYMGCCAALCCCVVYS